MGLVFLWARSVDSGRGSLSHRRRSKNTSEATFDPYEDTFGHAFNSDLSGNETSRISTFGELFGGVILFALKHIVL